MSDWELKAAARTVAEYMCNVEAGENVVIYADTMVEDAVADSIAEAFHMAGGQVSLLRYATRPRPDIEPPAPLAAAMKAADVLVELAWMYLIHTRALQAALDAGARFACLALVTSEIMKRCVGPVDYYAKVLELGERMASMLEAASEMRMTTPAGTDLRCNIEDRLIDHASKRVFGRGEQTYLGGQVSWYPVPESINGTLVFDGSLWPPEEIGLIGSPIRLKVSEGKVVGIEGGSEAKVLERWFESWDNPHIYELAHLSYGLNPGARLTGNILEDERVFGGLEVGIGAQPPSLGIFQVPPEEATSGHTDAIMLNPTVKSLDYVNLMFGPKHNLKVTVLHVLPGLPPVLIEESRKDAKIGEQLQNLKKKNISLAERLLTDAKNKLVKMGFAEPAVETVYQERRVGIARDICIWAEDNRADALIISSRGRTRLHAFFTGEIANKVLEYAKTCPIWMVKGFVKNGDVLLAVDHSENALRAVDHCGFMLSGTGANVTVFHAKRDLRRFIPKEVVEEFPEFKKFWQRKAGEVVAPYLKKSKEMLLKAGLAERQAAIKVIDGSRNTARDILDEARSKGIGTVVLGKRGHSNIKDFARGSIARKILDEASDMAVCMVP